MNSKRDDLRSLLKFCAYYQSQKTRRLGERVEGFKNRSVDLLMHRRGRMQKIVWHSSMVGLASVGFLSSGALGGRAMVASSFPGVTGEDPRLVEVYDPAADSSNAFGLLVDFKTSVSDKPRSEIIDYQVKSGETVSQIAQNFGISVDTIKWANQLESVDSVKPGQVLKILPVSGLSHTVKQGETLESVAKKYQASSQSILDFPFNDIPDDLKLKVGQVLIVPDGVPPEAKLPPRPKFSLPSGAGPAGPSYSAPNGGSFSWPTSFVYVSTYFSWWHPGIDLPNPAAPAIQAAASGSVIYAGWDSTGYGNRVDIDHGNGYVTRYGHLSNIYVVGGQSVAKGQSIGRMGSTGRSTGTHLHFEIRYRGIAVNPLAILK